jgi:hypothetical protein
LLSEIDTVPQPMASFYVFEQRCRKPHRPKWTAFGNSMQLHTLMPKALNRLSQMTSLSFERRVPRLSACQKIFACCALKNNNFYLRKIIEVKGRCRET